MSASLFTVWFKELKDAARDRRSLTAAMSYAFFGPMIMAMAFFFVASDVTSERDVQVRLVGDEHAPQLVEFLAQRGIVAADQAASSESAIAVTVPDDYQQRMEDARSIVITVRADFSERQGESDRRRVERALTEYNQTVASARLVMRGINPEVMQAVVPQRQDTSTRESRAAMILGTVMVFVLMAIFFSGMNVAIDISAGERERHSLEFLLAQPLPLNDLIGGKALAASSFAMLGGVLTLLMIPLVMMVVPLQQLGIDADFSLTKQLTLALVLLPLALLASMLQLFVSFMAKSFKEAQTYITFVMFAPMTIVFVLEFTRFAHPVLDYLPVTSQHQILLGSISGEPVSLLAVAGGAVVTLALSFLMLLAVARKLRSEKTIFGL